MAVRTKVITPLRVPGPILGLNDAYKEGTVFVVERSSLHPEATRLI